MARRGRPIEFVPILSGRCRCGKGFRPTKDQQDRILKKAGRWCCCSKKCRQKHWAEPYVRGPYEAPDRADYESYSREQAEWLRAIDGLRRRLGRVPTLREGFGLASEMGYRKKHEASDVCNGPEQSGV